MSEEVFRRGAAGLMWYTGAVDKHELKAIQGFLSAVGDGLGRGGDGVALPDRLAELSRIIQRLMNGRLGAESLRAKVQMARLERKARRYRREIEARLSEEHPAS